MGVDHYENFPVASWLMPRRWRAAVRAIYAFARHADDLADEGEAAAAERLAALAGLHAELERIGAGLAPANGHWLPLAQAIRRHGLPLQPLHDLLDAFEQDARGWHCADRTALLDYCRRSANPVGRLLLALYRRDDPRLLAAADDICTGLQLVNMWQDVAIDLARGRVYLPASELARHGLADIDPQTAPQDPRWRACLAAQTAHARDLLRRGAPLARELGGRVGWELRLVVAGGLRIAERIDAVAGDVFARRPRLGAGDWLLMVWRAATGQHA
jgi:squalene synthase HpnC